MEHLKLLTKQTTDSPSRGMLAQECIANSYNSLFEDGPATSDPQGFSLPASILVVLTTPSVQYHEIVLTSSDRKVSRSHVTLPPEVETFAEANGATEGVEVLCGLALEMVPGAEHVDAEVVHDPEDGESSLHVTVRTSADAADVVEAEEALYAALFVRVEPAGCRLLSLGYDFRG